MRLSLAFKTIGVAATIWSLAYPAFGGEAARRITQEDRRPPVARFYEERRRIEDTSLEVFSDSMKTLVEIDDLKDFTPVLSDAMMRLDQLKLEMIEAGKEYEGHYQPKSLESTLELVQSRKRFLKNYALGRFAREEIQKLVGPELLDFDEARVGEGPGTTAAIETEPASSLSAARRGLKKYTPGPIRPDHVAQLQQDRIPPFVFDAFNELIAENYTGGSAHVGEDEVMRRIREKADGAKIDPRWLDVEASFERSGWRVEFDRPGYNESYPAVYTFTKKRSARRGQRASPRATPADASNPDRGPATPEDILALKRRLIPSFVLDAFNELIAENYRAGSAIVDQDEVVTRIHAKMGPGEFDRHWLDVEPLFRQAGWKVEYDKPGYNENYPAKFIFTK